MKRILLFFFALLMGISGAWAQVVTTWTTAGDPVTKDALVASAGTGAKYAFRMPSSSKPGWCGFNSAMGLSTNLADTHLFTLENGSVNGKYWLKRVSNNEYLSGNNAFNATTGIDLTLDNRVPTNVNDYDQGYSNLTPFVSFDASGGHYNNGNGNYNFATGTGGWSVYVTYGPFYVVTVNYLDENNARVQDATIYIAKNGATVDITIPEIAGYAAQAGNPTSVTVDAQDKSVDIVYNKTSTCKITYKIVDTNGNEIYTFPAIDVNINTVITELPAEYQHSWFYDYEPVNVTADADKTVQVTATPKLFVPFTNFEDATWYYVTLRSNKYVRVTSNEPYDISTTNEETDAYKWAFSGNPYTGVKMYNKTTGASKTVTKEGNNPVLRDGEYTWEILPNLDGFVLKAPGTNNWYINNSNGQAKFGYWDNTSGRTDNGSTFRLTKVPNMSELLEAAHDLYDALNEGRQNVQIGYPTESALATFLQAITDAESITDMEDLKAALNNAIATVKSVANTVYTPRTDVYYTITSARGSMIYEPSYTRKDGGNDYVYHTNNNRGGDHINVTFDANNPNHQWGFVEKDGKYYMYNVGKQQFAGIGSGNYGTTWTFSNTPSSVTLDAGIDDSVVPTDVRIRATSAVTGQTYSMSISASYHGPVITYDAKGDGGIPMTFAVATTEQNAAVTAAIEALLEDLTPYRDALQDAIDAADALEANFGSGLNKYTVTGGQDNFDAALAAARNEVAKTDNETSKAALISARESLETAQSALTLTLNLPSAGFYRIKGKTNGNYLAEGFANNKFAMTNATDATTIFYYDGTKLTNLSSGMCNGATSSAWAWVTGDAASKVTFEDGATNGGYLIHSANIYLFDGGTNADRGSGYDSRPQYRSWYLEEVTTLPITLNAFDGAYYSTFYSPVNVEVSEATAYTLTLKSNYLSATEIDDDVIPANTGVILVSNSNDATVTATLTLTDKTPTVSSSTGDLTGTVVAATSSESDYIFTVVDNEIGFYKNGFGTVKGFKAFYRPSDSSVRGFAINFGLNDAITDILHQVSPKNVYDLQGRRVNEPAKGLYIINGKKVIK